MSPVAGSVSSPQLILTELKSHARADYPPDHPYRIAVDALPSVTDWETFLAQLRILLPLVRLHRE